MSTPILTLGRTPRPATPVRANLLASLTVALIKRLRRIDRWQLDQRSNQPKSAQNVMAWASAIESDNPGFASDLRGAALRSMNNDEA